MNEPIEPIWTKSQWRSDDLDHKTVEFRLPMKGGAVHGTGKFWVRSRGDLQSIEIVTDTQGRNWAERIQSHFVLPQIAVDRIEKHPDQNVAQFRLV